MFAKFLPAVLSAVLLGNAAVAAQIEATSSGIFTDPLPSGAIVGGVGTNNMTWGATTGINSNRIVFTGNAISSSLDTDFVVGRLTYTNGSSTAGTSAESFKLNVALDFLSPALGIQNFIYDFLVSATTNTSDPDASADFLTLPSPLSNTNFLVGSDHYTLRILGFDDVIGDGFLTSSASQFHVREEFGASANLIGRIELDPRDIPEPSSLALVGIALAGALTLRRKQV